MFVRVRPPLGARLSIMEYTKELKNIFSRFNPYVCKDFKSDDESHSYFITLDSRLIEQYSNEFDEIESNIFDLLKVNLNLPDYADYSFNRRDAYPNGYCLYVLDIYLFVD